MWVRCADGVDQPRPPTLHRAERYAAQKQDRAEGRHGEQNRRRAEPGQGHDPAGQQVGNLYEDINWGGYDSYVYGARRITH